MTYKQKMETEHPTVDSNYILFSCPGHFIPNGPTAGDATCTTSIRCVDCWVQEIPDQEVKHEMSKM